MMLGAAVKVSLFLLLSTQKTVHNYVLRLMNEKIGNVPEITDFILSRCHHNGVNCMSDVATACIGHLQHHPFTCIKPSYDNITINHKVTFLL